MNVGTLFTKSARTFPEKLAIAYGDYELTYQQANERINKLANALTSLGIKKGENVAILLHNCPEFIETLFACFKAGIGTVPINFRLHPKECSFIIDNSEAVAVVLRKLGGKVINSSYILSEGLPREAYGYYNFPYLGVIKTFLKSNNSEYVFSVNFLGFDQDKGKGCIRISIYKK